MFIADVKELAFSNISYLYGSFLSFENLRTLEHFA